MRAYHGRLGRPFWMGSWPVVETVSTRLNFEPRIDLDIEQGSTNNYATFIQTVRSVASQNHDPRWYYLTAAPQRPQLTGPPYDEYVSIRSLLYLKAIICSQEILQPFLHNRFRRTLCSIL